MIHQELHRGQLMITRTALEEMLHFPDGFRLTGFLYEFDRDIYRVYLESPILKTTPDGQESPLYHPALAFGDTKLKGWTYP